MKRKFQLLILSALTGLLCQSVVLAQSIAEIEQLSFIDAYRLWERERVRLAQHFSTPIGKREPGTGRFTPSVFSALTCRLGELAHLHQAFLVKELTADAGVSRILEGSVQLCERHGIDSQAQVVFIPGSGYSSRPLSIWVPGSRQKLWIEALKKSTSQLLSEGLPEGRILPAAVSSANQEARRKYDIEPFLFEDGLLTNDPGLWIWKALTSSGGFDLVAKVELEGSGAVSAVSVTMLSNPQLRPVGPLPNGTPILPDRKPSRPAEIIKK